MVYTNDSPRRNFALVMLCWSYLLLHLLFAPFHSVINNVLEAISLFVLSLTASSVASLSSSPLDWLHVLVAVLAALLGAFFILVCLFFKKKIGVLFHILLFTHLLLGTTGCIWHPHACLGSCQAIFQPAHERVIR